MRCADGPATRPLFEIDTCGRRSDVRRSGGRQIQLKPRHNRLCWFRRGGPSLTCWGEFQEGHVGGLLRRRLPDARPLFSAFFTDPTASVMATVVRTYRQERHVAESMLRAGRFEETGGATDVPRGENFLASFECTADEELGGCAERAIRVPHH
jgi:hypothetical protein